MDYLTWNGQNYGTVTNNDISCQDCLKDLGDLNMKSDHMSMAVGGDGKGSKGKGGDVYSQTATHGSPKHGGIVGNGKPHSGLAGKVKEGGRNVKQQRRPLQQTMAA